MMDLTYPEKCALCWGPPDELPGEMVECMTPRCEMSGAGAMYRRRWDALQKAIVERMTR
jgi:hypothetical protein